VFPAIVIELLVAKVWWRGIATISQLLFRGTPTRTLISCSMTCYSWYIAAVPHLHHTLTTDDYISIMDDWKYKWPRPLRNSYNLGLLPFVKQFRIRAPHNLFTPQKLNWWTLRYFSTLTNLQEFGIDNLQVPSFMPNIQWYFGTSHQPFDSSLCGNP